MLRDLAYGLYSRRLRRELSGAALPRHVGLIMDGNRRWARQMGLASPSLGHKYGAEHVEDVLNWCERAGSSGDYSSRSGGAGVVQERTCSAREVTCSGGVVLTMPCPRLNTNGPPLRARRIRSVSA